MSTDTFQNIVGLLNARGASIFQIAEKGLAELKLIGDSTGHAVPVLDSVREILQQTLELLNIKFQLDQITDNLGRFNNYNSALDDYINSYKRAREAIKIYSNALGAPSGTPCGPTPPTLPGPPPGKPFPGPETQTPHDPNDILGPVGIGAQKFVGPANALSYTIRFENAPVAPATTVAPAAVVTLTLTSFEVPPVRRTVTRAFVPSSATFKICPPASVTTCTNRRPSFSSSAGVQNTALRSFVTSSTRRSFATS